MTIFKLKYVKFKSIVQLSMPNIYQIVNFVIWSLFRRQQSMPEHLLCQGFERASSHNTMRSGIPGIICQFPNSHAETLTGPDWCRLLSAMGKGGDIFMVDLLL